MEVSIIRVTETKTDCRVEFKCRCGRGNAIWVGESPSAGDLRYVELEIDAILDLENDFVETTEPAGILVDNGCTTLIGKITIVEDRGIARMDFGCGRTEVEVAGSRPITANRYRIAAPELKLYDCDY